MLNGCNREAQPHGGSVEKPEVKPPEGLGRCALHLVERHLPGRVTHHGDLAKPHKRVAGRKPQRQAQRTGQSPEQRRDKGPSGHRSGQSVGATALRKQGGQRNAIARMRQRISTPELTDAGCMQTGLVLGTAQGMRDHRIDGQGA